jgi:hypothetical protein
VFGSSTYPFCVLFLNLIKLIEVRLKSKNPVINLPHLNFSQLKTSIQIKIGFKKANLNAD